MRGGARECLRRGTFSPSEGLRGLKRMGESEFAAKFEGSEGRLVRSRSTGADGLAGLGVAG